MVSIKKSKKSFKNIKIRLRISLDSGNSRWSQPARPYPRDSVVERSLHARGCDSPRELNPRQTIDDTPSSYARVWLPALLNPREIVEQLRYRARGCGFPRDPGRVGALRCFRMMSRRGLVNPRGLTRVVRA